MVHVRIQPTTQRNSQTTRRREAGTESSKLSTVRPSRSPSANATLALHMRRYLAGALVLIDARDADVDQRDVAVVSHASRHRGAHPAGPAMRLALAQRAAWRSGA